MINFDNFLQDLSSLELSGTVFGNSGLGNIPEDQMPKVVASVNSGLRLLYTKLLLKESFLIVAPLPLTTIYPLHSRYAISNTVSNVPMDERFIEDTPETPFIDDLIKVTNVWSTDGVKYPLNDLGQPGGMFTPSPNVFQLPQPMEDIKFSLSYQAAHPRVTLDTISLEIPQLVEDPLRLYVAHKLLSGMGTADATVKSQEHLAMFNMILKEYENADAFGLSAHTTLHKFNLRGFC